MSQLRIREIRKSRGSTIAEVAQAAGVSGALLSQVERARVDPSLETLRQIARVLEVPLFSLFTVEEDSSQVEVVRRGEETTITSPGGHLVYAKKSASGGELEVLLGTMQPGGVSHKTPWTHLSEECILVTKGVLTVEVNGVAHELRAGDSCYFDSRLPHRFVNPTDEVVEYVVAVTPPSN